MCRANSAVTAGWWCAGSAVATTAAATTTAAAAVSTAVSAITTVAAVAAATTVAAATATVATTAGAATEAARTLFARAGLVDDDRAAADGLAVHAVDGGLRLGVRAHLDKAEALRAAGVAVHHDLGGGNATKLGEVAFQAGVGHGVGQVAHVDFAAHARAFLKDGAQ